MISLNTERSYRFWRPLELWGPKWALQFCDTLYKSGLTINKYRLDKHFLAGLTDTRLAGLEDCRHFYTTRKEDIPAPPYRKKFTDQSTL